MTRVKYAAIVVLLLAGSFEPSRRVVEASSASMNRSGSWIVSGRPFTGIVIERDPAGIVRMAAPVTGGLPDGREWRWYADGRLESSRLFRAGRMVGRHRGWWPNGERRFESEYRDGAMAGVYRGWWPNGRVADLRHYVNGREAGLQQTWSDDGVLYLNYEAVDGRRYGLVNAKPCIPTPKARS